ncbi:hypothetical protein PIROE2DRAFT_60274 [Piromyces sp. E2]|nr:hypothetical protein PIROE2DRAFT_60274 [Piromyces sp. E2]|eukprot:OUM65041.1 hypothetical protein PIROE2DRAFT_60274 [Piromyces sp. E2]
MVAYLLGIQAPPKFLFGMKKKDKLYIPFIFIHINKYSKMTDVIKQRLIYPENILDQKTGQQFAEASKMFEEANIALASASSDESYAPAVLGFASGYLLQPRIVDIERGIFSSEKGSILRAILLDPERKAKLYSTPDENFNHTVKIAAHILIAFEEYSHLNSLASVPQNMLGRIGVQTGEMIIRDAIKAWDDVIAIESENSLFWYMKGEVSIKRIV